jgi:hypothetical protein
MKKRTEGSDKMCAEFGIDAGGRTGRRFSGVAGKTIKWMTAETDENNQPEIDIQFEDGESLLITWNRAPKVSGQWRRPEGNLGDLEPVPDKNIFE